MPLPLSSSRDNWERLVAAVLKRQQYLQLCSQSSRSPSISTIESSRISSFSERILNDILERVSVANPRVGYNGGGNSISSGQDERFKIDGSSDCNPVTPVQTNFGAKGSASNTLQSKNVPNSTSKCASTRDNFDAALEVVYTWGKAVHDGGIKMRPEEANALLPVPLQCDVVLDAHHIACGVRHAALLTKQGQVFTWGHESSGDAFNAEVTQLRLLESLSSVRVGYVACGEFHTCAVTVDGELYMWGNGTHSAGLVARDTNLSQWMPKRVLGSLQGLQVAEVTSGPWHTALITTTGQLFTSGDGTFGVLGHGNREDVVYPRMVESLSGLRTVAVACGVWHTAAVVEILERQSNETVSRGVLFTWGDNDRYQLGHGDMKPRLVPSCVSRAIDHDLHRIACGQILTVGLTTAGRVLTMGSPVYGQLGNPCSDGKLPRFVDGKLCGEFVNEISCGRFHVAVLTSKNEVYTWGKGWNGSLGHGDTDDRNAPTLVEALKDKRVKSIACGPNYCVAVCLHRMVNGAEQSHCSACRLAFGFTRKRHNCYNCGAVHCHGCSSRRAIGAALAPDPSKSCRVCDSCFAKLNKDTLSSNRWFDSAATEQKLMPRKHSLLMSATPMLSSTKSILDGLRKTNELLSQEVLDLRKQVESLQNKGHLQESELEKSASEVQEAMI
ncbi:PH, RCC1 and FYVE domains-containing protein 1-like [Salvia miltiorrhiza]|uniref:PH, RCC1 and FYVE domains-containing protein 1-like n=1 Tax=Salvia miltiorrhiza TaxID=226208 RepID=UPI0025ABB4AE|nr:PH, RCC1 and FYVE domains-containing protein 1-like [Salvia miltiorrhiza]